MTIPLHLRRTPKPHRSARSVPEVSAPKYPLLQTNTPTRHRRQPPRRLISTSSEPIVEQNAHEEIITQSIPERAVQETSAPSQTNSEGVISPDVVPRIRALESGAVPTDASTTDFIEGVVRIREQTTYDQAPLILFFVIAVGLAL